MASDSEPEIFLRLKAPETYHEEAEGDFREHSVQCMHKFIQAFCMKYSCTVATKVCKHFNFTKCLFIQVSRSILFSFKEDQQ